MDRDNIGRHNPDIKPCFHLAAYEETEYWDPKIVAEVGRIWQIAMYDESVHTHLCEVTPSYEMHPVYYVTERWASDETDSEMNAFKEYEVFYTHVHGTKSLCRLGNIFLDRNNGKQLADWNNEEEYQKYIDNYQSELTSNGEPLWFEDGEWKTDGQEERT